MVSGEYQPLHGLWNAAVIVGDWVHSTGYLVDAVFPPTPMDTFRTLLMALRRQVHCQWRSVHRVFPVLIT